ncbi:CatB-related O-acetyltransferase [Glutamicibacter sp. JC586]|uniref:CatB-related O-acetyltransferase n=1 Tax=Glutamicibacter sp. JC586 TaxID=2590552 RepID=UPI001356EE67|nr:CatB-related O-acetyltransferase [Glutamicibacter sp. JC586]
MKIAMSDLQPLLGRYRILLAGRGVDSVEKSGASYAPTTQVSYEKDLELYPYTTFWGTSGTALPRMGEFSYTHSKLHRSISVGRYTSIAKGMSVMGARHPLEWASTSPVFYNQRLLADTYSHDRGVQLESTSFDYKQGAITIGNDVWIGEKVSLGHGITIGDGAVIASNSVVTKDVAPYTVVGGLPAQKIKDRFDPQIVQALQDSAWWEFAPEDLTRFEVNHPQVFATQVLQGREEGGLTPLRTDPLTAKVIAGYLAAQK